MSVLNLWKTTTWKLKKIIVWERNLQRHINKINIFLGVVFLTAEDLWYDYFPTDLLRFGWHWHYLCWLQYLHRKENFWLNSCIVHITASSVTRPRYELETFIWKRRCHDGAVTVSQHPKHECVQLLWSILERAISQQFQVNFFACKQFSRSIWDTCGMRIFAIVGISRLRKWPKPCTFRLALSLWVFITVWLVYYLCVCGKFSTATVTFAMSYRNLQVSWQQ